MPGIKDVEGIGPKYAEKLKKAGVRSTDKLLEKGATPAMRKTLEEQTGIGHDLILEWVNHVDLYRIKGIGSEYSDLLEEAGVDSVPELAQRKPENLAAAMVETNKKKKIVRKLPTEKMVKKWVEEAKKLPRIIKY